MSRPRTTEADWPENREAVRFLIRSAPDQHGRQDFDALWWVDDRRRAQAFHGSLDQQVRKARADSVEVEIVDRFADMKVAA